jgi:hypothetical protein
MICSFIFAIDVRALPPYATDITPPARQHHDADQQRQWPHGTEINQHLIADSKLRLLATYTCRLAP